jgi:hypothetical protein
LTLLHIAFRLLGRNRNFLMMFLDVIEG